VATAIEIIKILSLARLDLSFEKRTQQDFASVLDARNIAYEREVRLSAVDIVDFLIGDVAVEIKLKGSRKKAMYLQLCRYAECDRVGSLILATNLAMGLPPLIESKPAFLVSLGRAWL
jgi:hypothetical protein